VNESTVRLAALGEDIGITPLDIEPLLVRQRSVALRHAIVGSALENRQMCDFARDRLDHLNACRTGTDDSYALACEAHRIARPARRVIALSGEPLDSLDGRKLVSGQAAGGRNQIASANSMPSIRLHHPRAVLRIVVCAHDPRIEADVWAQIESVGYMVEVREDLRLRREPLFPVPLIQELLREGVAIGVAFRIEPCARIAIPVPHASDILPAFKNAHGQSQLTQTVQCAEPRNAGADYDDIRLVAHVKIFTPTASVCKEKLAGSRPSQPAAS
jgi:hypothetical protein